MRASSGDGTPNTARARTPINQVQDTVKTVLRLEDYGGEEESSWVLLELLGEGEAAGRRREWVRRGRAREPTRRARRRVETTCREGGGAPPTPQVGEFS